MTDAFNDDMLEAAKANAKGTPPTPAEWGEAVIIDEDDYWNGRFRGQTVDPDKDENNLVYLLWDENGTERFIRHRWRLGAEMDRLMPQIGDELLIYRGLSEETKSGRTVHMYGAESRSSSEPLPAGGAAPADLPYR
jgi:hypothetical protein